MRQVRIVLGLDTGAIKGYYVDLPSELCIQISKDYVAVLIEGSYELPSVMWILGPH